MNRIALLALALALPLAACSTDEADVTETDVVIEDGLTTDPAVQEATDDMMDAADAAGDAAADAADAAGDAAADAADAAADAADVVEAEADSL